MNRSYLKRRFVSCSVPWRLLGILSLVYLVIITYYLTKSIPLAGSTHPQPPLYVTAMISIVCPCISGTFCLKGSWRHLKRSHSSEGAKPTCRFTPLLLGISGFLFAASQTVWLGQIFVTQKLPDFPSFSHFIGLLPYPLLIIGVLLLPTRSISPSLRLRLLLDSLIIMTAVTMLCYYFVLGPLLAKGDGTIQAKLVGGASPALGLLLMFCVLVVALRSNERILSPVLLFLGLATVLQFIGDVTHLYELLYHDYNEFSIANVGLIIFGFTLIGAAQTINTLLDKNEATNVADVRQEGDGEVHWKLVLPSVLVLFFALLVLIIWLKGKQSFPGQMVIVYIGGSAVLLLMLARQFLVMYQIASLKRNLQGKNAILDTLNGQLEQQATTDALTGVANHRALVEQLDETLEQAREQATPCSVIFMDIDHFKTINDLYGHLMGDTVLRSFSQAVTEAVRADDTVGRWGGEEFVAILPDAGSEEAFQIAERIRLAVKQRVPKRTCVPNLTCSLGVATYPRDAGDAGEREDLVRQADRAMYTAKRLGRNQTRTAYESLIRNREEEAWALEKHEKARVPEIVEALLALVEARDPALSRHARRVAALSLKLAQELGLSQAEAYVVGLGGLLHDLGYIAMPDELLLKRNRPANEAEHEDRARYPGIAAEILAPVHALEVIAEIVRTHCEWVDGSGYPAGLKGEEIPLGARIVAVASAYDAALGERSFRQARASSSILKELRRAAGTRFDPRVVEALERVLATSPRLSKVDVA